MSSALKPVLTPAGSQNSSVPSNLNKPMHPQGTPTNYGQPVSHIPQNLVNIPHNPPSSTNLHANVHSASSNHNNSNNTNHYSLNVPNASQHYTIGAGSHSAPVSNHPVPNQSHPPPLTTFTSPSKTPSYNPNVSTNIGHSYKPPAVVNPPTQIQPPPVVVPSIPDEPIAEKPQSNGTQETKTTLNVETPQDYCTTTPKEKPTPSSQIITPEKKVQEEVISEQKQNVDVNKTSEGISSSEPTDKGSTQTDKGSPPTAPKLPVTNSSNSSSTNQLPSVTVATTPTVAAVVTTPTKTPPAQTSPTTTNVSESSESQESISPVPANKPKEQTNQKPALKLATTPRVSTPRKPKLSPKVEQAESSKSKSSIETKSPNQKSPVGGKTKRNRTRTQPYQSPLPEVELISKISATTPRSKNSEDKLIIFYKNEFLAVRNSDGGFYICQAVQNIYKSSPKIRILWLSQDKNDKEIYTPDFYDHTDFDCILTNLNLSRVDKGKYKLPPAEKVRTDSILKRALAVEQGNATPPSLTEEHPDGLDLSLYKEESQLKKRKSLKRKSSSPLKASPSTSSNRKLPDQAKIRKVASRAKSEPVKKSTVLKKALSAKTKKSNIERSDRASKRKLEVATTSSAKTSPVIDPKKAQVLAKVARKPTVLPPKTQPSKNSAKTTKRAPVASTSKKPAAPVAVAAKKEKVVTRKSKRGKK